ncbi:MAG: hypothetical protein K0R12_1390 [Gammaproteobacteria bacterium]|jgi:hypothetical protein|nr:hypothetical protein [Gammaproteobacteria bacterium]
MTQLLNKFIHESDNERILTYSPTGLKEGERALMQTSTGEPFMPARLYFKFLNRKNLLKALNRLRCVDWNDDNCFIISYWEEARYIPLSVPYDGVPEDIFPILLAKGRIVNSDIYIDVRSFRRAVEMIKFLYKQVGPKFLYITHIAIYNRCISTSGDTIQDIVNMDLDDLFSSANMQMEPLLDRANKDPKDSTEIGERLEKIINEPLPVIQKLTVTGTKQGLSSLEMKLMLNLMLAMEYWNGNTSCTLMDIINKMAAFFAEHKDLPEEGELLT